MIKRLTKIQIENYFAILSQKIIPKSELNWTRPLDLVIAVLLSAQCTDKMVNRVTEDLFSCYKTAEDYLKAGEQIIRQKINSIGLYRGKARNIIALCQRLQNHFNNILPDNLEDLQSLAGVGRKTANVVLNVLYNQPTLAIDTHIFRLANRCGFVNTKTPAKTEAPLLKKIPKYYLKNSHHYLILHGRYVCKARKPECNICSVAKFCNYDKKNLIFAKMSN